MRRLIYYGRSDYFRNGTAVDNVPADWTTTEMIINKKLALNSLFHLFSFFFLFFFFFSILTLAYLSGHSDDIYELFVSHVYSVALKWVEALEKRQKW